MLAWAPGAAVSVPVAGSVNGIAVGDLNGDGRPDLAVAYAGAGETGGVEVLFNRGSKGLAPGRMIPLRYAPAFIAIGDLNGDGLNDLAMTPGTSTVDYAINGGVRGSFTVHSVPVPDSRISDIAIGDVIRGGHNEIVISTGFLFDHPFGTPRGPGIDLAAIDGSGRFSVVSSVKASFPQDLALAHFYGGPKDDIAYLDTSRDRVEVLRAAQIPPASSPLRSTR